MDRRNDWGQDQSDLQLEQTSVGSEQSLSLTGALRHRVMRPTQKLRENEKLLPVEWLDCTWHAQVTVRPDQTTGWFSQQPGAGGAFSGARMKLKRGALTRRRYRRAEGLMSSRMGRSLRGFTLVELLVVIAILVILAGLLLPT